MKTVFQNSTGHLGLGKPENRTLQAVERTTPTMFYLYGLIILWHEHFRNKPASFVRMWLHKKSASFADMLATSALRREDRQEIRTTIFSTCGIAAGVEKIPRPLEQLLFLTA